MWCHLCKKMFTDPETFSVHIMKKHRLSSTFNEDSSDSEHSKQDENDLDINESDETEDDNSGEEDFFSGDDCNENKSQSKRVTLRMNTRIKTKKYKFTPRNNTKVKIHSKLSKPNLRTKSKSALTQISKQLTNYNFLRNQPGSQPVLSVSCLNELDQPTLPSKTGFEFDSKNILRWLQTFKEMYKKFTLPLEPRLFDKIKTVHKEIFDNYSAAQSNEVTSAVLKVYEELDWLIHRHIISINESL